MKMLMLLLLMMMMMMMKIPCRCAPRTPPPLRTHPAIRTAAAVAFSRQIHRHLASEIMQRIRIAVNIIVCCIHDDQGWINSFITDYVRIIIVLWLRLV